jgi:small subunit ribosomal protein S4
MMGDPRRQRKKFETPKFPWRVDILQNELKLLGQYGLRNKRELWRHQTMLSKFRGTARSILGMPEEEGEILRTQTLTRLNRLGILPETAALDDVLDLTIDDVLARRLQSLVFRHGLAKSIHQARQFITHGHIAIDNRRVSSPSYLVLRDEEDKIAYAPASAMASKDHPLRLDIATMPRAEGKEETEE